jgi:hypothetical protein
LKGGSLEDESVADLYGENRCEITGRLGENEGIVGIERVDGVGNRGDDCNVGW